MARSLSGWLVVVGLFVGLAFIACTDQSGKAVDKVSETQTRGEMQSDSEELRLEQRAAPAVVAQPQSLSAKETRELKEWFEQKLLEAQENEEISEEKRVELEAWLEQKLGEANEPTANK